ncbi:MAG: VWA domain-containing protein [Sedimentisphaerales bacterium]|nr:VWA domain-containing protein [Sedimentisphaerales bacterium]
MKSETNLEQNIARLVKLTREQPQPSEAFREQLIEDALLRLACPGPKERTTMRTILQLTITIAAVLLVSFSVILFGPTNPTQDTVSVTDNQPALATPTGSETAEQTAQTYQPKTAKMTPLPLELPKPMFVGTPASLQGVPRLEKPRNQARPPFYAPQGTTNVALGKPVTSTDPMPIMGDLAMITNGDKEAADGSYVELGPFQQSITIDLEAECNIYAILFWHFHKQARVYYDVVVQVSTDPDFINSVTLFNNDHDNSAGLGAGTDLHYVESNEGKLIDAKGHIARYVRLISHGNSSNDLNHYIEVEVWGLPIGYAAPQKSEPDIEKPSLVPLHFQLPEPPFIEERRNLAAIPRMEKPREGKRPVFYAPEGTTNVALNKPVTSSDAEPIVGDIEFAVDGIKEGRGNFVELEPGSQHITVDLRRNHNIYAILFWHDFQTPRVYYDVIVQVSQTANFANPITLFNNDHDNSSGFGQGKDLHYIDTYEGKLIDAGGTVARYVRIYSNANDMNDLSQFVEIEVWGKPTDTQKEQSSKEQNPMEPLPIVLPKPMFVGTPVNLPDIARMEKRPYPRASLPSMAHGGAIPPNGEPVDAMFFRHYGVNAFIDTEDDPLSTFAIDVDTGSYTICRSYLREGHMPPAEAVRVEEFINYFDYAYPSPWEQTFSVFADASPWTFGTGRKNSYLLRIGIKGQQIASEFRKPAILTFVIDVSGSMNRENRLGLVKQSLRMLIDQLRPDDMIGIATYGSQGQKVMDHVPVRHRDHILSVIDRLRAGGSTYAEEGIRIGYEMAQKEFREGYINRVILCSDGVANVGKTGPKQILQTIQDGTKTGITLSALGFGMGNYNDILLEQLGDKGNGHYGYIDTLEEAQHLFGENLTSTLQVIARDVKVQVDFNPKVVRSYRLIGYENRDVPDDKFRDDKQDGGEIGAGHACTALYEIKLWDQPRNQLAEVHIRYKDPDRDETTEVVAKIGPEDFHEDFNKSPLDLQLATAIAEFAEILRKSSWARGATLDFVQEKVEGIRREWTDNKKVEELATLIRQANQLMAKETADAFSKAECSEPEDLMVLP